MVLKDWASIRKGFEMATAQKNIRTVLIVERNISDALYLQDRIVRDGSRALTAYSLERALLLAQNASLDDAVIDFSFERVDEIAGILKQRKIPYIFHVGLILQEEEKQEEQASRATRVIAMPGRKISAEVWNEHLS